MTARATSPAEAPRRTDPRVIRTRKLIRDALASLLATKNFESISVQDIAEAATVNRATFYAHFTDKFALLEAMIRDQVAEALGDGDPLTVRDTRAALLAAGTSVFSFVGMHRECRIDREFEPLLQRSLEAELTDFLTPRFGHCTALLISSAFGGAAMTWRHEAPKFPAKPIVENIVDILVHGVASHDTVAGNL
ncbi:MAG TPA: TetR/AcrR family transcriptional regulator [Candidatus Acidoferrales bacterium]|nr:TetR/AcrR family transcriptional regulator [Candidatus Acidoferrales bacterium]